MTYLRTTTLSFLLFCLAAFGCDPKESAEVGGTCASMGGIPCVCDDGSAACTNRDNMCLCKGGNEADGPLAEPQPPGGDCSSMGGKPCDCPDGSTACSDHEDVCLCDSGSVPVRDEPKTPPPPPPG